MNDLDRLLEKMLELDASDIHLNHNARISFRVDGEIQQIGPYIHGDDIFTLLTVAKAIDSEEQRTYTIKNSIDFSYALGKTRFRGSLINQKGKPSCVMRKINAEIVSMDDLGLPPVFKDLAEKTWGMIIITGPTGSGKTTTLASVVDYINERKPYHIATIEQPLEYIHTNKKSIVTQREVGKGKDTPSFAESMKDVLRQDPDVILVGEMRDYDTVTAAVTNAETGHLVLGTLHTNTAPQAINRIVSMYPAEQHLGIRSQIADNLLAVINQRLVKKPGGGRTALYECMILNENMRQLIRENKDYLLYKEMEKAPEIGNRPMAQVEAEAKAKGLMY